jgi:hypothetical protein
MFVGIDILVTDRCHGPQKLAVVSDLTSFRPDKGCAGDAQQKLKTTDPTYRQRGCPHQQIQNCLKIIKERRGKNGCGSQTGAWHQDRLADWPSVVIWLWLWLWLCPSTSLKFVSAQLVVNGIRYLWVCGKLIVSQFVTILRNGILCPRHRQSWLWEILPLY